MSKVYKKRLLPKDWKWIKIGELAKTSSGGTPKSTIKEYYENGTIPWINSGDLNQPYINQANTYITNLGLENSSAKIFPKQSLLIALYGATAGRASILKIKASTNQAICAVIPNEKFSSIFLKYNIDTLYEHLIKISTGSARDNLSQEIIRELSIAFPSLNSQQKIASILSSLDDKIELNNQINDNLEKQAKLIYDYWFVQFEFPDKDGKPYKSSGGKMVYNKQLKREIPEGWEVKGLGEYISFERGVSYKSSDIQGVDGRPMLNLNSFHLNGEYKFDGIKYFSGKYNKTISRFDLLVAITDVTRNADIIGKALIVPNIFEGDIVMSCDIAKVVVNSHLDKYYLEMLFNSKHYHNYIKGFASGTLVLHLNLDGVSWYKTEVPTKDLLNKFNTFKTNVEKKRSCILKENQQLSSLRDWLLPMLMNGQVKVE